MLAVLAGRLCCNALLCEPVQHPSAQAPLGAFFTVLCDLKHCAGLVLGAAHPCLQVDSRLLSLQALPPYQVQGAVQSWVPRTLAHAVRQIQISAGVRYMKIR